MTKSKINLNKFVTGAVTATMVATAVVPVASAAGFTDIENVGTSVQAEINQAVDLGFFKDATKFNPSTKITRGQAALTLARYIAGESTVKAYVEANNLERTVTAFNDVPASYKNGADFQQELYYASLVVKNADAFTQSTLNPTGNVTRSQMAKIITQTFGLEKVAGYESNLTDIGQLDAGTKGFIETIASHGITNVTTFNPAGPVTRSQMASFLVRSYDAVHVEADLEITSVKELNDITIEAGEEVTLPSMVEVVYSDATTADVSVNWNTTGIDFAVAGTYELTGAIANTNLKATVKVNVVAVVPAVTSVKSINATQVEVKFNTKIDETEAIKQANYTFTALDGQGATSASSAVLQNDGKTVLLTANMALEKRYQFRLPLNKIETEDGTKINYNETVTFAKDTVAPTVTGFEQITAGKVRISFSEPVDALAAAGISFKDSEGNAITKGTAAGQIRSAAITKGDTYFDVDLTKVDVDKKVTVTFNGLLDLAGNLVSPQPASIVVEKKTLETFAPTLSSVTQTGATTFNIKFSHDLDGNLAASNISLDNGLTVKGAIKKLSASEYEVTTNQALSGVTTVTVAHAGIVSSKGQAAPTTDLTKLVTFIKDEAGPKATAKLAVNKDNEEVIELTFDKDVELAGTKTLTLTGSSVINYVTTPITTDVVADYVDATTKKVVHISLKNAPFNVEGALYNLELVNKTGTTNGIVSVAGVAMDKVTTTFSRGKDGVASNSNAHVLTASDIAFTQGSTNNEVDVTYTIPTGTSLDGPTAINVANYTIAGTEIESASLAVASGTTQVVTLKLKQDSNTFTGVRNATVKNVKIAGSSVVMTQITKATASLDENVLPTISNATITAGDKITLTFSESITSVKGNDFLVKAGTATVALSTGTSAEIATSNDRQVVITLKNALTAAELAEVITVAPSATTANFEVKDSANNGLATFAPITVVKP